MIAIMMWIAVVLTLIGAFFTSKNNSADRVIGFVIWFVSNILLVICYFGHEWAMVCQFTLLSIFSVIGLHNNLKEL